MFNATKTSAHLILAGTLAAFSAVQAPAAVAADAPNYFPVNLEAGGLPPHVLAKMSAFKVASPSAAHDSQQYVQYETEGGVVRIPIASASDAGMKKEQASTPGSSKN
jgi:hypothetical protein